MFQQLNNFISHNVSYIIVSGIFVGLLCGSFASVTDTTLSVVLFLELFIACFKINVNDARAIKIKSSLLFLLLRYVVLAVCAYYLGSLYSSDLGVALLLLTLLPAGVSSPGFAAIFNANIILVVSFVLVSSLLSPLYIPFMLEFVAGTSITIDATQMLQTILLMVVLPIFVHIPLRKVKNIRNFIVDYNPLLLIPMVWFTIVVPVARYRDKILADVENSLILVVGFMLLYLIYILFSLLLCRGQSAANRKSFIVASSIHNVTLGVVLAFLYLSNEVSYLVVFANISLILIIAFLKKLFVLVRVCQGE